MINVFRRAGLGAKLSLLTGVSVATLFLLFTFLLSQKASQQLEALAVEDLHNQSTGMVDMVQMFNTSLSEEVESYTRLFTTFLPQPLNIDTSQAQTINGLSVPLLKGGDTGLHQNNTLSDEFLNRTGAISTLFVRSGNDFVRVATSLRKENGERAMGTVLDTASPAFAAVNKGEVYRGLALLFGKRYITQYQPVKNAEGQVIAIVFVGVDITHSWNVMREKILTRRLGESGHFFVLDRSNGKLVVPAPEKPVPQGAAKGDYVSKTQPFSDLSFRPKKDLSGADMWGATMFDQLVCRVMFHQLRYEGIFTPPSEQGTLVFPGNLGMFEWGGISVDPNRQVAIANPMALPFVSRLIPRGPGNPMEQPKDAKGSGTEAGIQPQYGVPFGVTLNPFLSPFGLPCKQPAWGYISGLDLKTNQIVWKKRIGTPQDSMPFPMPVPVPFNMGMPMLGGPISTAGNVLFIAATADNYLRAYNMTNGEKLWQGRLPAGGQATPMTYEVNGKQYVVISAGGHGSFGTKMGDYIVAYALPDENK